MTPDRDLLKRPASSESGGSGSGSKAEAAGAGAGDKVAAQIPPVLAHHLLTDFIVMNDAL